MNFIQGGDDGTEDSVQDLVRKTQGKDGRATDVPQWRLSLSSRVGARQDDWRRGTQAEGQASGEGGRQPSYHQEMRDLRLTGDALDCAWG